MPNSPLSASLFDPIYPRIGSDSQKWARSAARDLLPLWVADSDFQPPAAVLQALQQRLDHAIFGYGQIPAGMTPALQQWCSQRYNWQPDQQDVVYLPGLVPALHLIVRTFAPPELPVLVPTPVYPPFFDAVKRAGLKVQELPLSRVNGRWRLLPQVLDRVVSGRGQLLLFCNPHNPTGTLYQADELAELAAVAQAHDLRVCSDEIHCDLLLEENARHLPFAAISEDAAQRSLVLMAPSKSFNLAGLGCSYALVANPQLRRQLKEAAHGLLPAVNLFGYVAAEAALREGGPWLDAQCRYLAGNRTLVNQLWQQAGLDHSQPQATYLSWVDLRPLGVADVHGLFEQHGVSLSDGVPFGGPGHLRLNFGCARPLLQQALLRCRSALEAAGILINH